MANTYTKISFAFECPSNKAEQLNAVFNLDGVAPEKAEDYHDSLKSIWPDYNALVRDITGEPSDDVLAFDLDGTDYDFGVYHIFGTNVNLDQIVRVVQTIMKPEKPIIVEYASDCSKPRTDSYGGGVCVIFSDKVMCMNTYEMAQTIITSNVPSDELGNELAI